MHRRPKQSMRVRPVIADRLGHTRARGAGEVFLPVARRVSAYGRLRPLARLPGRRLSVWDSSDADNHGTRSPPRHGAAGHGRKSVRSHHDGTCVRAFCSPQCTGKQHMRVLLERCESKPDHAASTLPSADVMIGAVVAQGRESCLIFGSRRSFRCVQALSAATPHKPVAAQPPPRTQCMARRQHARIAARDMPSFALAGPFWRSNWG